MYNMQCRIDIRYNQILSRGWIMKLKQLEKMSTLIIYSIIFSALKIIYFSIKRRYTKTLVVEQNPTEESEVNASRENVFNGSSSESLNLEPEKECVNITKYYYFVSN